MPGFYTDAHRVTRVKWNKYGLSKLNLPCVSFILGLPLFPAMHSINWCIVRGQINQEIFAPMLRGNQVASIPSWWQ